MPDYYPFEQFSNAVREMATSSESLQKKVADAYTLRLSYVKPEQLPEQIRQAFLTLKERIDPASSSDSISATTENMSVIEASKIIHDIIEMVFVLAAMSGRA